MNFFPTDVCVSLCEAVCFLSSCFYVLHLWDLPESFLWNGRWQAEACAFLMAFHSDCLSRPESKTPLVLGRRLWRLTNVYERGWNINGSCMRVCECFMNILWMFNECLSPLRDKPWKETVLVWPIRTPIWRGRGAVLSTRSCLMIHTSIR